MKYSETEIPGVVRIDLEKRSDHRGFFARVWCATELREKGLNPAVAQINTGFSPKAGTLRGLHFQAEPHAEVKIVRCLRGAVFDVVVDLRPASATFRRWTGFELTPDNGASVYIPEGCAHGYLTLAENSELMYLTSRPYAQESARGVRFDDTAFNIRWPRAVDVVSDADRGWPDFAIHGPDAR